MSLRHLDRLFQPRSIAVIGASAQPRHVGQVVMRNLLAGGFDGPIMPVNPKRTHVAGVLCYPDVASLPLVPDLAVICSPPDTVPCQIEALGQRGVHAAVVITGGLRHESQQHGPELLNRIRAAARAAQVRVLGPDGLGLIVPGRRLNASFSHVEVLPGKLALVCQTAGLTATMLDWARPRGIGFSCCVSLGDCADLDFGVVIDYLSQDPATRAILLYIENLTERGSLLPALRTAARTKPILCIKRPHVTAPPADAVSVTGALTTPGAVADAALRRAGALRVHYLHELFEAADTLSGGRPLRSEALTILTNNATHGQIAADEVLSSDGQLAMFSPETMARLDQALPFAWSRSNPLSILIDADKARYASVLEILLADKAVDQVLVLHAPSGIADPDEAAAAVVEAAAKTRGNIITSWAGGSTSANARKLFAQAGIPSYDTTARAARAFLHMVRHRRNQALLIETPPSSLAGFSPDIERARAVITAALAEGRTELTATETASVLAAYDLRLEPSELGRAGERPLILGVTPDRVFGPVILFGEGGEAAKASRDTAIALPPLNPPLARDLISRTRVHRSLATMGDQPEATLEALGRLLVTVSQLVVDLGEITDLDLNPVLAGAGQVRLCGARLWVAATNGEDRRRLALHPYPKALEERVTLRDGTLALLRPIRPEDEPAHQEFFSHLTPEDIRYRFFGVVRKLDHVQMARLTQIDYDREMAFIAVVLDSEGTPRTLGVVRSITDPDNTHAEFAMLVRSDLKGRGLGGILLRKMVRYCREHGTSEITGQVMPDNPDMLRLVRRVGFTTKLHLEEEVVDVRLRLNDG
ncbi:acetyltransferase [uncultured Gammaproteobacteria bacterium]